MAEQQTILSYFPFAATNYKKGFAADVVTLNVFSLTNTTSNSRPDCAHIQTYEVVHPLTAPGGYVYDPLTLLQEEHAATLTSGRRCEFCNKPTTGFMSLRHNYTPWIDFADQIHGRNTLLLRAYFPFNLMSAGVVSGPFRSGDHAITCGRDREHATDFSARLKQYGFYGPNQTCIVVPTCKHALCNSKAKNNILAVEQQIGLSPELPWFAQPFTTALGKVVCQFCGDANVKLCKKNGKYCGFGYCSKEHQVADWNNHKKVCKQHRESGDPPPETHRLIINHTFVGHPTEKLRYFAYPENIDVRLLDTTTSYFRDHFDEFARNTEQSRRLTLRGTVTETAKCAVCKNRPAVRGAGFQSIPITSKDESSSNKHNYYKAMVDLYSKAGAFPRETTKHIWEQFEKARTNTAQMATLVIPVCNQQICIKQTPTLHATSVTKLVEDSSHGIDPSFMYLGTVF